MKKNGSVGLHNIKELNNRMWVRRYYRYLRMNGESRSVSRHNAADLVEVIRDADG